MHCCRRPGQCDRLPPRQQNSAEPGAEDEFITPFRASSRHAGRHEAASAVAGGRNFPCAPFHHDRSAEWISPAPDRNFKTLILQTAAAAGMIQRYRILSGGEAFRLIAVPNERGELQFAISNRQRSNLLCRLGGRLHELAGRLFGKFNQQNRVTKLDCRDLQIDFLPAGGPQALLRKRTDQQAVRIHPFGRQRMACQSCFFVANGSVPERTQRRVSIRCQNKSCAVGGQLIAVKPIGCGKPNSVSGMPEEDFVGPELHHLNLFTGCNSGNHGAGLTLRFHQEGESHAENPVSSR